MDTILELLIGPFSDHDLAYSFQRAVAYAMMCLFIAALVFQSFLRRPGFIRKFDENLWSSLGEPSFVARFQRSLTIGLVVLATLVSASYFSRNAPSQSYLHKWDAYHTVLGAKYHDELGYFDLYKCTIAIGKERGAFFNRVDQVRNLRTRKYVPVEEHLQGNDCKERFSQERLAQFQRDIDIFGPSMRPTDWARLFKDKGFNGTPFYTVAVKGLLKTNSGTLSELTTVALLDPLLMVLAFLAVGWAFGVRTAALFAIFFCCFFPNRYVHMGGSILRFDYVAALTVGICALQRDRWGVAGALFAWATMVRVFPLLFAGAVVLKIGSDLLSERRWRRRHGNFVLAYGLGVLLLFALSLVGMDGPLEDWIAWWENMRVHNQRSASFRIGFKHLFMLDGSLERVNYTQMQSRFNSRRLGYFLCVGFMLAPLLLSIRRLSASTFCALFGSVAFFLLVVSTRYYYSVVALLFLVDRDMLKNRTLLSVGAMLFGASAFDFFYFGTFNNTTLMYNFIIGAQMSLVVVLLGFGLLFDPGLDDGADAPVDEPRDSARRLRALSLRRLARSS